MKRNQIFILKEHYDIESYFHNILQLWKRGRYV